MTELKAVNLAQVSEGIRKSVKPVSILWQAPDTIAFVARGRAHRSEFHADPSDEVMYMIKGEMNLHYLTPEGAEKVGRQNAIKRIVNDMIEGAQSQW